MNPRHAALLRRSRSRGLRAGIAMLAAASVAVTGLLAAGHATAAPPVGQGFKVTPADLAYILKQIKIAERHAATRTADNPCGTLVGPDPDQIPSPLLAFGLRTVDGSCNNLQPGQETYGAADQTFPRLAKPVFEQAEDSNIPGIGPVGPPGTTSYAQTNGSVVDSEPRMISNLIVDQTYTNPAAVAAATQAVRAQSNDGAVTPCEWTPGYTPPVNFTPNSPGCVPSHETLVIENVTTDVGLSPPFNSFFTIFGQFFDHGLDKITNGGSGTVFVPLKDDDPLVAGPDHVFGNGDDLPVGKRFMVLTRGTNVPGKDGFRNSPNTDTPFVDQSQTYTSHASHQVFLREYVDNADSKPVSTGRFLSHQGEGIATWAEIKAQAAAMLGLKLTDADVTDIPMIATDPYGKFIPGPVRGLPQYVTAGGLVEGDRANGGLPVPADVKRIGTAFLNDIAHAAAPTFVSGVLNPDTDTTAGTSLDAPVPAGSYDNELLDLHAICGDGRCNENIALQAVHQVFHSEHDRLVGEIKGILRNDTSGTTQLSDWQTALGAPQAPGSTEIWNGERLFQAARFITEMQYQHLVFEEFARKVQPAINPFEAFAFNQTDVNPAITAEFAHAVYRFGHSMLDDDIPRVAPDGTRYDIPLLEGFLNPAAYYKGANNADLDPKAALTGIVMGLSDQPGNEIDEFVSETLRNNLLGLPLDLPALNMTRARSEGIPPLNSVRRQIFAATNDGQLAPYTNWIDFGEHLRHRESLVNFVAAYGTHPLVLAATTVAQRRQAAEQIVNGLVLPGPDGQVGTNCATTLPSPECAGDVPPPDDAGDFVFGTGAWAGKNTGLEDVDLWVGGLAENTNLFGGLLGSTFNYVFENQLTNLQNGDRFYYLARTPGMNLRASLEGNSFAELVMRNSDAHTLKADPFATADCKFETGLITGPASSGGITGPGSVDDVTSTDCNENALILQQPDGTVKYRATNSVDPSGINGQAVYNGTAGTDRIYGGNDNDTFWGGEGRDIINGGGGDDVVLGGDGNDIITDFGGADVPKGGPGNDAIDGGIGDDIIMGGDGDDFTNGGANLNEHFLGEGDDYAIAGQGTDAVFGDGGDDWAEGGDQPDLLIGDSSTLFFDDHNKPGHDVLIGQGGDDDYDMEGGDDIGVGGPGVEKNAGASGWDWLIGQGDPQPQFADLALPIVNAPPANETRDRFNEVEALSGWKFDDKLLGDDIVPSGITGGGFIGCDALDQAGIDRIAGLSAIVPPLTGPPAVPTADVVAGSVTNYCMLTGDFVWGQGNILLGGEGSDTLTGRGADDIIDGDRWLRVRISHRTDPADPGTETGWTDLMENKAVVGDFGPGTTGMTLQQAVFAGLVDPGNLVVVREVVTPDPQQLAAPDCDAATPANCDTAVFLGPRTSYSITTADDGTITVAQTGPVDRTLQKVSDDVDTVRNVEQLKFADVTVTVGAAVATPDAPLAFGAQRLNVASTALLTSVTNTGTAPVTLTGVTVSGPDAALFTTPEPVGCVGVTLQVGLSCTVAVEFRPTTQGDKTATLTVTRSAGPALSVPLSGTGVFVASAPSAPSSITTLRTSGKLTARWSPNDDGGSPVTGFRVRVVGPGGAQVGALRTAGPTATQLAVSDLTVGTAYRFQVAAVNAVGTSGFSALSAPVVFATKPSSPRSVTATRGAAGGALTAVLNFRGPSSTGGIPLTGFRVWALRPNGTVAQGPFLLPANARKFTFTLPTTAKVRLRVQAYNEVGGSTSVTTTAVVPR